MASYDLKAILGSEIQRLSQKVLKAVVDGFCTIASALCSIEKRVSALENVEFPEGGYKPVQEPVASPTANGTAIQFIDSFKQDANGVVSATKRTVRSASASQSGVMSAAHYSKLDGIAAGAEVNVQSDWDQTDDTQDDYIKNKPNLAQVATSGSYNDLSDKPSIPAAQVQSDWAQTNTSAVDYIKNKPDFTTYYPTYGDNTEFNKILAAYNAGKRIVLPIGELMPSFVGRVLVPLTKVVYDGNDVHAFVFEYVKDDMVGTGTSRGEICKAVCAGTLSEQWSITSLTAYTAYNATNASNANNADITRTADAANGDKLQIGTGTAVNVVNAKNATNDSLGGSIKDIYICDLKKVNTSTESGYVFSGFSVKNDDSAIGNRKYIEALYSAFPHPKMWFLPIPVQDSTTSDNVHLEDINGGYYSVACHKDAEHSTIITDTFTAIGYGVFEIDFDYRILRESSSSTRVGLKFALCALSNAGTSSPTKKVSVNDTTIFASATESFDGSTSAWFGGHVHMIGDISNASGSFASSKSVALLAGFTLGEIKIGGGYNTGYLVTDNITVKAYNKHL